MTGFLPHRVDGVVARWDRLWVSDQSEVHTPLVWSEPHRMLLSGGANGDLCYWQAPPPLLLASLAVAADGLAW